MVLLKNKVNKLFVYGTLMQGEKRAELLKEWKITDAFEIPGTLYDTGRGYPAADFSKTDNTVYGELYLYGGENLEDELNFLDDVEGVSSSLYSRRILNRCGHNFYTYEMSSELYRLKERFNVVREGNWRRTGSLSHSSISEFASNFESSQSERYKKFPANSDAEFIYLKGEMPVLIVSAHATSHMRKGSMKVHEKYTAAINIILNALSGVHSLYTVYASEQDSNYYKDTKLKNCIRDTVSKQDIRFVLDIHGTGSYRKFGIYPGIGKNKEFLDGQEFMYTSLRDILLNHGITLGGTEVFPAYRQYTVSRFVYEQLGIPAMQVEINKKYREPETNSNLFEKLIYSLREYINGINRSI